MWIEKLALQNIKSFAAADLEFSKSINLLFGPNNSGKSTILNAACSLARGIYSFVHGGSTSLRIGQDQGLVQITLAEPDLSLLRGIRNPPGSKLVVTVGAGPGGKGTLSDGTSWDGTPLTGQTFPQHFIVPYLSRRKVVAFSESVNADSKQKVEENNSNLFARIDDLSVYGLQSHEQFRKACEEIFGFPISTRASPGGKTAGYPINETNFINLGEMGEGTSSILGLLVHLCKSQGKLFIIEEPENDIHPSALRFLLEAIS
jgi:hypothetical protein